MLQNYTCVMVAVDGSEESDLAYKKAINITMRNNAELVIVHVVDTRAFETVTSFDGTIADEATDMAQQTLADYKTKAKEHGCEKVSTVIEYGAPKPLIAKTIPEKNHVDLIILGATGLNAIERLFIGSVSEYVTRHAICDVLIVRTNLHNQLPHSDNKTKEK